MYVHVLWKSSNSIVVIVSQINHAGSHIHSRTCNTLPHVSVYCTQHQKHLCNQDMPLHTPHNSCSTTRYTPLWKRRHTLSRLRRREEVRHSCPDWRKSKSRRETAMDHNHVSTCTCTYMGSHPTELTPLIAGKPLTLTPETLLTPGTTATNAMQRLIPRTHEDTARLLYMYIHWYM